MNRFTLLSSGLLLAALSAFAGEQLPKAVAPPAAGPIEFVANRQQWEKPVLFAADVPGGRLFLEQGRLVQALYDGKQVQELHHHSAAVPAKQRIRAHAYSTTLVGANPEAVVDGESQLPGYSNYFLGNDHHRWASNVPGYGEVRYRQVYPGIDLHFYSKKQALEYDFEVAAGADAKQIVLQYAGQTQLRVIDGALHIATTVGTVIEQRPVAYQLVDGKQQRVACEYALSTDNTLRFSLPQDYNHQLPLVIDPVLVYSTYTGSSNNYGYTATYDTLGNLYAGGSVFGTGYPTTVGAYDISFNSGIDMGIIKYNPAAATGPASRVYATYIGGNQDDHPHSLVVDHGNNLIVLGSSASTNYPTTTGAYDTSLGGTVDIVLTKLNSTGSALVGSTFLGGNGLDGQLLTSNTALRKNYGDGYRGDVTVSGNNSIYLASMTSSTDFPTTTGAFQRTAGGGASDGVVSVFNATLTALTWSSYLGGSGADAAYSVQLDNASNLFVGGGTASSNFPGVQGGYRSSYQGGTTDGFVARISPTGNSLVRSTYLGTSDYDQVYFVQLNSQGEVYTYGQTLGTYAVSPGVYANAGSRQFIQKLNPQLTAGIFSTVVGNGPGTVPNLSPTAFLVDDCGQIIISGWTSQGNMPITSDAIQATGGSGTTSNSIGAYFYIGQLSANAQTLIYGTYFGNGNCHVDGGTSRFDKKGIIYQSMCVGSGATTLITTPNAWSRNNLGGYNNAAFKMDVLQLNAAFVPATTATSTVRQSTLCAPAQFFFNRPNSAGTSTLWDFGNGQTSTQPNNATTIYPNPGRYAVRLTVFDVNSCLQSVTSVDTVEVYAMPRPQVTAASRQSVCQGSVVTLTATNLATGPQNVTYTWTASGQIPQVGQTVTVRPTVTTRYTVTAAAAPSVGGCLGSDTVTVRVLQPPAVSAGPARAVCPGASTTLSVADFGPGATYTWTAPGQPTRTGQRIVVQPTASIRYVIRVVDGNGCQGRDSVQLTVPARPTLAATASTTNIINKPVTFTNTSTGATSYRWDFGDNTPVSTQVSPTHVYTTSAVATPFQVRLTAVYGPDCEESILLPVRVRGFDLPNIITPNGDGKNDSFKPFVTNEKVDIQLFNRWGRLVYEQKNYVEGWGPNNVPPGVYYYRLVSTSGENWKGWLEVVR